MHEPQREVSEPGRSMDSGTRVGQRLRDAREAQGLTLDEVGARLHLPRHVVVALEEGEWRRLGASVFVRGHVHAYAKLLGLPVDELCSATTGAAPPLVAMAPSTRMQRMVDQLARRAVYIVLTAVLVVPVLIIATQDPRSAPRVALDTVPAGPQVDDSRPSVPIEPVAGRAADTGPVLASLTPIRARNADATGPVASAPRAEEGGLVLRFAGESWIEVLDGDGVRLDHGVRGEGSEIRFTGGRELHVTLGNAAAVQVRAAGRDVDTGPYRRANVARFTVSSDGALTPGGG